MLDEYQGQASTDTERKAVGELFHSVACAIEMDFEPSGSTSNINKTPFAYQNFFRYTSHYETVSWPSFWSRLNENVLAGYPVPIAVSATATGDGHVVVANGYREIDGVPQYYLNWGWYNDNNINGWYNIQGWTSASGGYNTVDGAVFDIMPNPQITSIEPLGTGDDITVNWEVSENINWDEFTLEQKVDQGDWEEVATGISSKNYTISNPSGNIYQFRVKSMIDGIYYANSWSEVEVFAAQEAFDGYAQFGGLQYAYARQTPDNDLDFTGDYTFETWIRLKDGNSNGNVILDHQPVFGIELTEVTDSDYSVKFISNSSNATLNSNASGAKLNNNEWVHIAVVHSANNTKLFVDGSMREEDTSANFNLTSSNAALNMAERYNGEYSGRIIADLDQVRLSNVARYTSNFTAAKDEIYTVDDQTKLYLPFQGVHKVRLKDASSTISFIVKNELDFVEWNYDETSGTLSNEEFELVKSSLSVFPNPVTENKFQVLVSDELKVQNLEAEMYDLQGRKIDIKTSEIAFNNWELSFQNINSGVYVIKLIGEGFSISKKLSINN